MSEFQTFLQLGLQHIVSLSAYDHLLFIVTLCAIYELGEWRKVLVLVTAFTIGHSLTLLLSGFEILQVRADLVELLIPVTILLTALHNVAARKAAGSTFSRAVSTNYILALCFGLIHGMGFANFFRSLMGEGSNVAWPLFSFNVGIEIGQIFIVALLFGLLALLVRTFRIQQRDWNLFVSGAGAGGALILILQKVMEA